MTRKERRRRIRQAKLEARLDRIERGELWSHRFSLLGKFLALPLIRGLLGKKIRELR
jgi:hypothetical protein